MAFAIFIAGSLTGMLAVAVLRLPADATTVGLTVFALGFVLGMITIAIALKIAQSMRFRRKSAQTALA